jgi:hypothetical protein
LEKVRKTATIQQQHNLITLHQRIFHCRVERL